MEVLVKFEVVNTTPIEKDKYVPEAENVVNPNLYRKIDEMELSVRSFNCLINEGIRFIGDLVQKSELDMLKLPNFGRKSLNELKENLKVMGLGFDMKLDNWPPENLIELSKKKKDTK